MESILPASRNYQVSASVENLAIDEYALVKQDDSVRPFFVYPLKGDPDAAAVSVSFTGAGGVQAGNSFLYILESARDEDQEADYDSVFILDSLSGTLPVFSIPGGLEPGPYTMVFQVFGRNQVLISRNKKNIFYMADEDYEIRDIRVYLPAFALPVHLIPPGTSVMLEASINAGADLDPYIVWYNGKSRINEGRAADGAARILWKVPSQTGFCNIRAEVIPFPPLPDEQPALNSSRQDTAYHGKTLELSLPVSARGELKGTFSEFLESAGSVLCDYRLAGNLADSAVQADSEIADDNYILAKVTNNADSGQPLWYPSAGVYGLLTGSDNIYRLPFEMPETGSAGKQLVFL
ncbi:MAG: hypothetical protein FWF22_10350, partial [Treponema sp.]|nr:hypothetical protein [Treponema sp.]